MEPITLAPLGTIQLRPPRSYAAVYDLINTFTGCQGNTTKLARLCCAALGICWSEENPGRKPPEYNISQADPVSYGGDVMHWLVAARVDLAPVYERGTDLILAVQAEIPSAAQVDEAKDFSVVSGEG